MKINLWPVALSDGSFVFDVHVTQGRERIIFNCVDENSARTLAETIEKCANGFDLAVYRFVPRSAVAKS